MFLLFVTITYSQKTYKDFTSDYNPQLKIMVGYINDIPVSVKYKGNSTLITLVKINGSKKYTEATNGSTIKKESFNERINGKTVGRYDFTNEGSGIYIMYTRKDGKKLGFSYSITEESID